MIVAASSSAPESASAAASSGTTTSSPRPRRPRARRWGQQALHARRRSARAAVPDEAHRRRVRRRHRGDRLPLPRPLPAPRARPGRRAARGPDDNAAKGLTVGLGGSLGIGYEFFLNATAAMGAGDCSSCTYFVRVPYCLHRRLGHGRPEGSEDTTGRIERMMEESLWLSESQNVCGRRFASGSM